MIGAVSCFVAGYIYNNAERLREDFEELRKKYSA
jgi:hypothetical protein